ncbi:hypothetical protein M407DRAFT_192021 [Tulasnella calospora MUT 4182]|uniref:Uncharacterized protein n=1 Tax=Tulasnella calospora MUT 4182 TaxID=1051891 RepID=A0A0C3QL68_9AGAM|nr:hypothetical protein M407DRAFT_192021 [Tulasnella calospora MUT 4182]
MFIVSLISLFLVKNEKNEAKKGFCEDHGTWSTIVGGNWSIMGSFFTCRPRAICLSLSLSRLSCSVSPSSLRTAPPLWVLGQSVKAVNIQHTTSFFLFPILAFAFSLLRPCC